MATTFPDIGRWISVRIHTENFKCKVLSYEEVETRSFDIWSGHHEGTERQAVVMYEGGDEDVMDEYTFKNFTWNYIRPPTEGELAGAEKERYNKILGYRCNSCQSTKTDLLKCSRCKQVRYCDRSCQASDWASHKDQCRKVKLELRPHPRYPLGQANRELAKAQKKRQDGLNNILRDALTGHFKVQIGGEWRTNPKATDLETLGRYKLVTASAPGEVYHFKQRSLESLQHGRGVPTSCSFFMTLELCLDTEQFRTGGLHYLVSYQMDPNFFWGMAMNFNTFGTVAPFHTDCDCRFPKMPPKYKSLRKSWDLMFRRARDNLTDVQCMFADQAEGCHSYGLPGDLGCRYRHEVTVERETEEKKCGGDSEKATRP